MKIVFNNLKLKFSLKNRSLQRLNLRFREENSWAVITGCTSGIGKSYAEILCYNNFNLILIGRNDDKLNSLSNALKGINKDIEILNLKWDFSDDSTFSIENYNRYLQIFSEMNIRLLVNNVGETTFGGDFNNYDVKKNKSIVNVNINSTVFTTNLFINSQTKYQVNKESDIDPNIKDKDKRRGIINMSSYFGLRPVPGVSIYSSTKSFISNFSSCIFYELKSKPNLKIDVLCINPLFVMTGMVKKMNPYLAIQPEEVIYSSFLRINSYKIHSYGHYKHFIQSILLKLVPNFIFCRASLKFYTNQYNKFFSRRRNLKINK